jgi:hypothetical protein
MRSVGIRAIAAVGLLVPAWAMAQTAGSAAEPGAQPSIAEALESFTTIRIDSDERGSGLRLHEVWPPGEDGEYRWSEEGRLVCVTPCTLSLPTGGWYGLTLNKEFWFEFEAAGDPQTLLLTDRIPAMRSTGLALIVAGSIQLGAILISHLFMHIIPKFFSDDDSGFLDGAGGVLFGVEMVGLSAALTGIGLLVAGIGSVDEDPDGEYPDARAQHVVLRPGEPPF